MYVKGNYKKPYLQMKKCRMVLLPLREIKITVIRFSTSKTHRTSHTFCSRCYHRTG